MKGHGNQYDPQEVLKEFKIYIKHHYKKQAYYLLSKKYNKSIQHIRRIVREAQLREL